jgi:hypothetical protein
LRTKRTAKSINISVLADEARCYRTVRELRWNEGSAWCDSPKIVKNGHIKENPECQKYCAEEIGFKKPEVEGD